MENPVVTALQNLKAAIERRRRSGTATLDDLMVSTLVEDLIIHLTVQSDHLLRTVLKYFDPGDETRHIHHFNIQSYAWGISKADIDTIQSWIRSEIERIDAARAAGAVGGRRRSRKSRQSRRSRQSHRNSRRVK